MKHSASDKNMFKSQSVDKMLSSEGERKCFWLYWELQLRKNLINVSKETDQKFLLNLFCNYEIQPKRLHSNLTFQTPSAKRTAIQHLSCSSPRTPERAARDIPVSQTGAAMAGQLSEQSKVVILAKFHVTHSWHIRIPDWICVNERAIDHDCHKDVTSIGPCFLPC